MNVLDFHNHFYPRAYLQALEAGPSNVKVSKDGEGMQSMDDALLTLVRGGVVTAADATDHLTSPDLLPAGAHRPGEPGASRRAA